MMSRIRFLIFSSTILYLSCSDPDSDPEDCAGITNGSSICGCTDSTAFNYNSNATHDDGSCEDHLDNGDYFLYFNGFDAYVDLGDVMSQGSYTKAAWVRRSVSDGNSNNILSGNTGHAFWAPENQGARLSSGHNGNYSAVQDPNPLPENVWTFVAVTFDVALGKLTLYANGVQVSQATGIEPQNESTTTYISRFASGYGWKGSIDEVAIWGKALGTFEIAELSDATSDGGYIIGAAQNTIIKTDSIGTLQWYYRLSYSSPHYVEDVLQTFSGDYIVVGGVGADPGTSGHSQKGQAFILRMSEGGGVQWVKRYGIANTPNDSFWGVVQADDGGFVMAGEKLHDRNFEFYDHFWVMKTDGNGNEVWSHELGGNYWDEALDIIKLSDDSYILTGKNPFPQPTWTCGPCGSHLLERSYGRGVMVVEIMTRPHPCQYPRMRMSLLS